MEESWN